MSPLHPCHVPVSPHLPQVLLQLLPPLLQQLQRLHHLQRGRVQRQRQRLWGCGGDTAQDPNHHPGGHQGLPQTHQNRSPPPGDEPGVPAVPPVSPGPRPGPHRPHQNSSRALKLAQKTLGIPETPKMSPVSYRPPESPRDPHRTPQRPPNPAQPPVLPHRPSSPSPRPQARPRLVQSQPASSPLNQSAREQPGGRGLLERRQRSRVKPSRPPSRVRAQRFPPLSGSTARSHWTTSARPMGGSGAGRFRRVRSGAEPSRPW